MGCKRYRFLTLCGALVLALLAGVPAGAEQPRRGTEGRSCSLFVPVDGAIRLQMSTKRPVRTVVNSKEAVLDIRAHINDPSLVVVVGLQPGLSEITMTDVDGKTETVRVVVPMDI
jgi:hypothetical protein